MYLSGFKQSPYLMIEPDSNLDTIDPDFLQNKYVVRLFGEFEESFIQRFVQIFNHITHLDVGHQFGVENNFIYDFPNLEGLAVSLYSDSDFILDCARLPKTLKQLDLSTYCKKKISNMEALAFSLEQLSISGFKEKDLSSLAPLKSLTTLSFKTASIKSLNGIEELIYLKRLSLGGVRSLVDLTAISSLQKLKFLEIDIAWKLQDCSPIGQLGELEVLQLMDCKNLASIQFVRQMSKLRQLYTLGTTVINDYDTTPAEHVPIFFGSFDKRYNKMYPEKEIREGQRGWSSYS